MEKILVIPSTYKSFKVTVKGKPPGLIMKKFGQKAQDALDDIEDKKKEKTRSQGRKMDQ